MYSEIEAIAQRLGWTPDVVAELQGAVQRIVGDGAATSGQATLDGALLDSVDPADGVTLGGVLTRRRAGRAGDPADGASARPTPRREEKPPATRPRLRDGTDRYEDLGLLGVGGMGEVRRVRDRELNRTMAMKIIPLWSVHRPGAVSRFVDEAQCSAQLQHPGIVPVHELGQLPDGRHYFTMREVRGRTLTEVIAETHQGSEQQWANSSTGWSFRRLVDAFLRVCEAVAYAHTRGVVHRDLKPDNVMLGAHGEVLVLDWGLAKVTGRQDSDARADGSSPPNTDRVVTARSEDDALATRMGHVAGTPAYMPPEQARGETEKIDARADIYALGAILYHLLGGRPPYSGATAAVVLEQVRTGPPEALRTSTTNPTTASRLSEEGATARPTTWEQPEALSDGGLPLPAELVAACNRAMARRPQDRFADATGLAAEVRTWLDGARRREQALAAVELALALEPEAQSSRRRAQALREQTAELLEGVERWRPEEAKAPAWAKEDEAVALEREAESLELRLERGLYAALRIDQTLPEAHAALAERLTRAHQVAEAARDADAVERSQLALAAHSAALPASHPLRSRCTAYLRGDGALTLVTDPPGAEVLLHRYELRNRRLVPVLQRSLGHTPLVEVSLPMGSYLCLVRHPDRLETRYPVFVGREQHWDGIPPGGSEPMPVRLLRPGELAADDCYVPAGWYHSGGDPGAGNGLAKRRLWCDGLIMKRFHVTNAEYLEFLDDLVRQGRTEEALTLAPRERGGVYGEDGAHIFGFDQTRFFLQADAEGDVWYPDAPVMMVHFGCAVAYARWLAQRDGQPWRLPGEHEWEKTGRGVDGRFFMWGDFYDPSWTCNAESHEIRPLPAVVHSFPVDESVYGVRGLGGNTREWCAELRIPGGTPVPGDRVQPPPLPVEIDMSPGARRVTKGGFWTSVSRNARCANRGADAPTNRLADIGVRLARSLS
jgi:eukaryotic-like serine/threonine-protein kinase